MHWHNPRSSPPTKAYSEGMEYFTHRDSKLVKSPKMPLMSPNNPMLDRSLQAYSGMLCRRKHPQFMHKFDFIPRMFKSDSNFNRQGYLCFALEHTKVKNITHRDVIAPRVLQMIPLHGTGKHGSLPGTQSNCKL